MKKWIAKAKKFLDGFSVQRNAEAAIIAGALAFSGALGMGQTWQQALGTAIIAVFGGSFIEGRAFKINQKAILDKTDEEKPSENS